MLDKTYDRVDEVFALPIGLKPALRIDGKMYYTSARLNENFIKALSKSGKAKPLIGKFADLVRRGKINPLYASKGFTGFVAWKIFAPSHKKGIVAFYSPDTKSIYIIISNNANIFAYISNSFMAELAIHESIHMFADSASSSKFLSLFGSKLLTYYKKLWSTYFQVKPKDIKDDESLKIIKFIFDNFEKGTPSNSTFVKYYKLLNEMMNSISNLDDKQYGKFLMDYILLPKYYISSKEAFFSNRGKFPHVFSAMYQAYKDGFNLSNTTTLCVQELIYPSEIIAILSEGNIDSKIKTALNAI